MAEEHPSFDKKPFERKHLDTAQDIVNTRLNPKERAQLQYLKSVWHYDQDSTVLKLCLEFAHNVVSGRGLEEMMRQIASPRRLRPGPRY